MRRMIIAVFWVVAVGLAWHSFRSTATPDVAQARQSPHQALLPLVRNGECRGHAASMSLASSTMSMAVGDVVTVTVTLANEGCASLGLPQYRLSVRSSGAEPTLDPSHPEPIVNYLGVGPGDRDLAQFVLRAVRDGQATVTASASFEAVST